MKQNKLTKEQKEELEKFGANTWFVEYLHEQYEQNPSAVPEQWQNFFGKVTGKDKENGKTDHRKNGYMFNLADVGLPVPAKEDETRIIAGSSEKILENMNYSLTVPVATSQRTIPVKLLEENRTVINQFLKKNNAGKVSFTHIISWAILKAVEAVPALNNAYTIIDGKPSVILRKNVNLGLAIDLEKKDGTRSLIVPNIKNANQMNFKQFIDKFNDLVTRSRKGQIDPAEFLNTTMTLTNPGTIGTAASIPRLMVGQGAIIATGAIQYSPDYQAMSPSTISALGVSKIMTITSTYDHRIIQGAESGLFLKEINDLLLGKNNFYEEIFEALNILYKPYEWKADYQPGIFDNAPNTEEIEKQAKVLQLINMYRVRGHLIANLDPLGFQIQYHAELDPASYNFTIWDMDRYFITGGFSGIKTATLRKILEILQKTYCEKIGAEFMHIQNPAEKIWLQNKMEPVQNIPDFSNEIKKRILNKLIKAETFEHFIHTKFIGHKRFSIEGSETLIPVLDMLLDEAAEANVQEVVLGMAHRGRLNVLVNIIGKSYESILSEFEDIPDPDSIEGSGDVKYHLGATGKYKTYSGKLINVSVAPNPSHLEWVNPVVEGIVRAKQTWLGDKKAHRKVLSLLIHGDAAFAGQGIVAETLNLSQLSGYRTGGTVHIIINNQIGFTTTPEDARSSVYASDVAKMIQAPIFHVNGDDPEASLWVTRLAFEYRQIFKKDVVIDLFGYRRHGHNEGDEPGFTQPLLYDKIKSHPSVKEIYEKKLLDADSLSGEEAKIMSDEIYNDLSRAFDNIRKKNISINKDEPLSVPKEKNEFIESAGKTAISQEILQTIIEKTTSLPEDFTIHPKLKKFLEKRKELITGKASADWAMGETLAFGSLLLENTPVRLSGQDSVRGTFSQRHLALTDIKTGKEYIPLNHLSSNQSELEALDSLLSEAAVLGFEFGYSTADPSALVMWEAQFGDFANSAQVIIDNFIVASYEKWNVPTNLVLLLPHGYEGQGPEHSSARLERFLILCAENNMRVCHPSTPSQYFHVLRRQIKSVERKPLILMTPKSLLRLPDARSPKEEFTGGSFVEIINDNAVTETSKIHRIILTSGKLYYELKRFREENRIENAAIIRIEQFYPYEKEMIENAIHSYPNAEKIIWVQEEPVNMGAWGFLYPRLIKSIDKRQDLSYSGRPESASPAVGSAKISTIQEKELLVEAFKE